MTHNANQKRLSLGSFLLGAVVGGLAGAAYALLNAPQSGAETRQQLRDVKNDFQQRAQQAAQSAKQHGTAAADEIASRSQNIKNEVQQAVDAALSEGKEIVRETKTIAQKGLEDVEEDVKPKG
jgi:gas vesicle protein